MRILHIITGTGVGGAEGVLLRLLVRLRDKGAEQSVISLTPLGAMADAMREQGFQVDSAELRTALDLPSAFLTCRQLVLQFQPDIVQTWMYHADLFGGLVARIAGVRRVVWGIRMSQMIDEMPRSTRRVISLCALASRLIPNRIIAAAEASRASHEILGYDLTQLTVIPNGFDLPPVRDAVLRAVARQRLGLPDAATRVIGAIGRYEPVKDQPTLVRAFAQVAASSPGAHLVLIGRGCESSNSELMEMLAQLNLETSVTLAGEHSNARELLPAFDIFCLPSRSEGFPNVLGEAMAAGIPCVSTDVGDAALLLADTGVVVKPRDPLALARGIQFLLEESAGFREKLGQCARTRISENFSMERTAESYFSLYGEMISADSRVGDI
jgi:glycosyltransferase involved in cell wall biosynthesis